MAALFDNADNFEFEGFLSTFGAKHDQSATPHLLISV
jgi:hypothetical protein